MSSITMAASAKPANASNWYCGIGVAPVAKRWPELSDNRLGNARRQGCCGPA
jgi:hypothetical protein